MKRVVSTGNATYRIKINICLRKTCSRPTQDRILLLVNIAADEVTVDVVLCIIRACVLAVVDQSVPVPGQSSKVLGTNKFLCVYAQ